MSQNELDRANHSNFIKNEILRNEYLNQSFNFMPELKRSYDADKTSALFEDFQLQILRKSTYCESIKVEQICQGVSCKSIPNF